MPVKNAAPYLDDCLTSIQKQSEEDWELLAVNDHSEDESLSILEHYASIDARIQVFQNQGQGIIPALRTAFAQSKGTYITRMDADDLMPIQKLATLKKLLVTNGLGHLATGKVRYFSEGQLGNGFKSYEEWLNSLVENNNHYQEIYKECVIPSPCWMVHRKDFQAIGAFQPNRYPEDYDLCFRFYEQGLKVCASTEVLHDWRDYPIRTSRTHQHYSDNRFLAIKLHYFLKLDRIPSKSLVIWGAGKKGKWLAKNLTEKQLPFHWVCNNPQKIGKHIYDQLLRSIDDLNHIDAPQILIAVASPKEQDSIRAWLKTRDRIAGKDYFFFC